MDVIVIDYYASTTTVGVDPIVGPHRTRRTGEAQYVITYVTIWVWYKISSTSYTDCRPHNRISLSRRFISSDWTKLVQRFNIFAPNYLKLTSFIIDISFFIDTYNQSNNWTRNVLLIEFNLCSPSLTCPILNDSSVEIGISSVLWELHMLQSGIKDEFSVNIK